MSISLKLLDLPTCLLLQIITFAYNIYDFDDSSRINELPKYVIRGSYYKATTRYNYASELLNIALINRTFRSLVNDVRQNKSLSKQFDQLRYIDQIWVSCKEIEGFFISSIDRDYTGIELVSHYIKHEFIDHSFEIIARLLVLEQSLAFDMLAIDVHHADMWLPKVNKWLQTFHNLGYKIRTKAIEFHLEYYKELGENEEYEEAYQEYKDHVLSCNLHFRLFFTLVKLMSNNKCSFGRNTIVCKKCDQSKCYYEEKKLGLPKNTHWNQMRDTLSCSFCNKEYDINDLCYQCINTCDCVYNCNCGEHNCGEHYNCKYACDNCKPNSIVYCSDCNASYAFNCEFHKNKH